MSLNQEGPISGHYMQVDGEKVLTNALSTNQKSKLIRSEFKLKDVFCTAKSNWQKVPEIKSYHKQWVTLIVYYLEL